MLAADGAPAQAEFSFGRDAILAGGQTPPKITLRPIEDADHDFLCRVYSSTRAEELAPVPWTDEEKAAFLRQQFEAQHAHYARYYHGTAFDVILADGVPVGRLYLARWEREIRLVDIALLPEHRRRGIGTRLIHEVLAEAAQAGKTVSIHVEFNNPAMALYERLGFRKQYDDGALYSFMEWRPETMRGGSD